MVLGLTNAGQGTLDHCPEYSDPPLSYCRIVPAAFPGDTAGELDTKLISSFANMVLAVVINPI